MSVAEGYRLEGRFLVAAMAAEGYAPAASSSSLRSQREAAVRGKHGDFAT